MADIIKMHRHDSTVHLGVLRKRGNDNDHPGQDKKPHKDKDNGDSQDSPSSPPPPNQPDPPPARPNTDSPNPGAANVPSPPQPLSTSTSGPNTASLKLVSSSSIISTSGTQPSPSTPGPLLAYSYVSSIPPIESTTTSSGFVSSSSTSIAAANSSASVAPNDASAALTRTINIAAITGAILAAIFILIAVRVLYAMFRRPRRPTTENSANNYPFSPEFQPAFRDHSSPSMDTTTSTPVSVTSSSPYR